MKRDLFYLGFIVSVFVVLWVFGAVSASETNYSALFAGGTGEPNDPYQIATVEQLRSIGSDPNLLEKHYILVNNIDLDPYLPGGQVFNRAVIAPDLDPSESGFQGTLFSGSFDGKGYCIRHLTMKGTDNGPIEDLGLFGEIEESGEIKYLMLEGVDIKGNGCDIGMLTCVNRGVIKRCSVEGTIVDGDVFGGIAAWNFVGTIEESKSTCIISTYNTAIGGALIGVNKGDVKNCYASGFIRGWGRIGGLVGDHFFGSIYDCYAVCQVEDDGIDVGGFAGWMYNWYGTTITRSYFLDPNDGGGPDNGIGTPLTAVQMARRDNFIGWDFWDVDRDSIQAPWYMPEGGPPELTWLVLHTTVPVVRGKPIQEAYTILEEAGLKVGKVLYDYDHEVEPGHVITTHPYLKAPSNTEINIILSIGPYDWKENECNGDKIDPYLILSPGQLDCLTFRPDLWNRNFKLIVDLNMNGYLYERPLLGGSDENGEPFNGDFDGNGHLIYGLTIAVDANDDNIPDRLGFFGEIGSTGSVQDLGLTRVLIKGIASYSTTAGMLCALNHGTVNRCFCHGVLQGCGQLGGLVGCNTGSISNCYAEGEVMDMSGCAIQGSYAGLVADNSGGTLNTCYAACSVPLNDGYGLVAYGDDSSFIENGLWDTDVSDTYTSMGGRGLSTLELIDMKVFQDQGWGGNPNWILDNGNDYPRLLWEGTPGSLIPESQSEM